MWRSVAGEMFDPAVNLGIHNAGTAGGGETCDRRVRFIQNKCSLEKRTCAAIAETIEERVGPTTLPLSIQRQVLGVGVGRNLHSRIPLRCTMNHQ